MFKSIKKRNGTDVPFKLEKITNAIYKASVAVGSPSWQLAENFSKEVLKRLEKKIKKGAVPEVEEVQDVVEQVLIEKVHPRIAKAYILYRQHRAEIRQEKKQILNKTEVDDVDKKFDINSLRVLASRYLKKDEEGNIIESPKELFTRVAVHAAIPSLFYDTKVFKKTGKLKEQKIEEIDYKKYDGKFSIGKYKLNEFHVEGMARVYERIARNRQIKVSWQHFLDFLKKGYFDKYESEVKAYYDLMTDRKFLPNTPAIANFGNYLGMGSACFTLGIADSIDKIMDSLKSAAIIFKSGGGLGYNFSHLRPEGDFVRTTGGIASGPISFMSMFDNMTEVIKQGGIRRGANMGILNSDHPDLEKFIHAKEGNKALKNFNISVMMKAEFWDALENKKTYKLVSPKSGKVVKEIDPAQLLDIIAFQAWESAEPGMLFHDIINEYNPFLKQLGPIESTNPCGEVPLYPFESCNLGSINVWNYLKKNGNKKSYFDWQNLAADIRTASRFLDNVVDINNYPLKEIEEMTIRTRKLGLGIMGLGDLLYEMEIPYNSKEGLVFMEKLMEFVNYYSKVESVELSKERGRLKDFDKTFYKEGRLPFAGFKDKSSWHLDWKDMSKKIKKFGVRNGFTTVIAPTGSISMIAGCSSGIEPVFSLVFEKNVAIGNFYYIDPVFDEKMQKEGLMDEALIKDVATMDGSVQKISYIPLKVKKVFVTAMDISPKDHIKVLAIFQKWTDSAISKTTNLPSTSTVEDIKSIYMMAHDLGCKGVTIYRDKSLKTQVLVTGSTKNKPKDIQRLSLVKKDEKTKGPVIYHESGVKKDISDELDLSPASSSQSGFVDLAAKFDIQLDGGLMNCPTCNTKLAKVEGCTKCLGCGWGMCSSG
ncbi:ribonucleoside-diphosphate reductase [Candidatus Wolfebacteria bacterium CG10_big_fil_rev_8_21_14_0_10_31_9]|uniref:Vitamin B12-dependent ribonucleotide reductase n=1 Tax=Candidatus Wolfebacteria bacterium CG10_big_fil_rev_8_21_14_0_10_31_9 TaxID=1975070 RepID=A0A2H0RDH8_9BACT|nr:MAG: ribonucleoside-diphosphate reductase [Candidatus Wolfebacteria bacterium CG10_big_fil_rev_8_21_14_0_10_31_9]